MTARDASSQNGVSQAREKTMSRKLTSTLLLFAISVGFFVFGITHIVGAKDVEDYIIYSLYLLVALVAFIAVLRLPSKSE